jgi:hypothetical protein
MTERRSRSRAPGTLLRWAAVTVTVTAAVALLWTASRSWSASPPRTASSPAPESLASPLARGPVLGLGSSAIGRESVVSTEIPATAPREAESIRGLVVDELGVGVAGASVSWITFERPDVVRNEITGDDGSFRVLPPTRSSTCRLRAVAGTMASEWLVARNGQRVELRLAAAREVQCVVVDPAGAPIAGAYVELLVGNRYAAVAKTDNRGVIERQTTPVAQLRARVSGQDLVTRLVPGPEPFQDPWIIVVERADVELAGVVTSGGIGVAGASVKVAGRRGPPLETDARGGFRLGRFARGQLVTVAFEHPRLRPSMICTRAEPGEFVQIELRPGRSAEVIVVDAQSNAPVVGARVACDWDLSMALTPDSPASGVTVGPRATTDAEGRVTFASLLDRAVGIAVRADGFDRFDAELPVTERFVVRLNRESACHVAAVVPPVIAHLTRGKEWTLTLYHGSASLRPGTLAGTVVLDCDLAVALYGLPPGEYDYTLAAQDGTWHSTGVVSLADRAQVCIPGPDGVKYVPKRGDSRYRAIGKRWASESDAAEQPFVLYRQECEAKDRVKAFVRRPAATDFDTEVPWYQLDVR